MTKTMEIAATMTTIFARRSDGKIFAGVGPLREILWVEITPVPQDDTPEDTENDPMIFLPDGQSVRVSVVASVKRLCGGFPLQDGTLQTPYVIVTCKGTNSALKVDCASWDDTGALAEAINAQLGQHKGES